MPTFNIFKEGVLSLYKEKKSKQEMDELLASPSPANLRDYCLVRLSEGLPETDIQVFQKFFNPLKKEKSLEDAIYNYKTGWLRALQKFILGETENPDELLVKLLAVLVDYQPRPFKYSNDPPTTGEPENTPTTGEPENTPTTGEPENTPTTGEQGKTPTTGEQGKTPTAGEPENTPT
uniref:hypothetical protein n=1 Tax=Sphingobacterium sp. TaxID=341027 RepID=UPI0028983A48